MKFSNQKIRISLAGVLSVLVALASGEFVAAIFSPRPGPVFAVANRVIDLAPTWFVDFGKTLFNLNDKPALILGTILITCLIGILIANLFLNNKSSGVIFIIVFGLISFLSIGFDAQAGWVFAFFISLFTGVVAFFALKASLRLAAYENSESDIAEEDIEDEFVSELELTDRRRFIVMSAGATFFALSASWTAKAVRALASISEYRATIFLRKPKDNSTELEVADAVESSINQTPGISPVVMPNDNFYKIDTTTITPQVDPREWELKITGMVDKDLTYSYEDLLDRSITDVPVTLSCVSNPIGDSLVGNAVWQGVPLSELLDEAGVQVGASQIASRSVDGWTCGFPTEVAFDGRNALVAVGMNGEPLPIDHGFPARLVVSGLYGYVSATKWLSEIFLTTWEGFDGFWMQENRGWSKLGPVKTQSRIDTPFIGEKVTSGEEIVIAGVAWAPNTGITKVEVQTDLGDWVEADLGESLGKDSWLQWRTKWTPTEAGQKIIKVRATDASGATQTSESTPVRPDGATGHHTIFIEAV